MKEISGRDQTFVSSNSARRELFIKPSHRLNNTNYGVSSKFIQAKEGEQEQSNVVPLRDRQDRVTFTETQTYESFLSEVRSWLARNVVSRTIDPETQVAMHRENSLVSVDDLRSIYNSIRHGEPVTLLVRRHSNGYSYRSVIFTIIGEEISVVPENNTSTVVPEQEPEPRDDQSVSTQRLSDYVTTQTTSGVARAITNRASIEALIYIGAETLGSIVSLLFSIFTWGQIANEARELVDIDLRDRANGFGMAVLANRLAHFVFTNDAYSVQQAAHQYIEGMRSFNHPRNQELANYMEAVLSRGAERFYEARNQIDINRETANSRNSMAFRNERELAQWLINQEHDRVTIRLWRNRYHEAWKNRNTFFLENQQ